MERTPHRFLVIDSESRTEPGAWGDVEGYDLMGIDRGGGVAVDTPQQLQVLRCWSACLTYRHGREKDRPRQQWHVGETREQLSELIAGLSKGDDTLWVFAHNLSYDLALTGVLMTLLSDGWTLGRHNLASDAPWAILRQKRRVIRLADSWSWLPVSVDTLGQTLDLPKLDLPAPTDKLTHWLNRCVRDVQITTAAIERLMNEWDRQRLGNWSLTGPASAWNTLLHRSPGQNVIIDPDPVARRFERQSLYSGRRDVLRVGNLPHGPYAMLDLRHAYATVCAAELLPVWRGPAFDRLDLNDAKQRRYLDRIIAHVTVNVPAPRYPVKVGSTIVHPVGTFQTVLAGPEIKDAYDRGHLVSVGAGYSYRLGVRMQPWAQWVLTQLRDEQGLVDPLLKIFLQQASRTVPGRWGMLIQREGERSRSWRPGWFLEPAVFGPEFKRGAWLHLNGEAVQLIRDQDGDDAFPGVLSFIQSWVRVVLQKMIDTLGSENVLQVNTDGAWVPESSTAKLGQINQLIAPYIVRVKATSESLSVQSPQHVKMDRKRIYAGVPSNAREIRPDVFQFQTWPKLAGQMRRGDPRGYVRELRTVDLTALPVTRWVAEDGCTEPLTLTTDAGAGNRRLGPSPFGCAQHHVSWRVSQHPALSGALTRSGVKKYST